MDEETGAAGYMICGGLYGENTVLSGWSLSNAMIVSGHYIFAGICLALFFVAILAALVVIRLLENYSWIRTRRKRYAFA